MSQSLPYHYGLLLPFRQEGAASRNASLLGPLTLGIEVTEPELAMACGLGNIDPQHDVTSGAGGTTMAAIEAALEWPLPPRGAMLVTIRPDADAFGAMAVLSHRALGKPVGAAMRARIGDVARDDAFRFGSWKQWRKANQPLPVPASLHNLPPASRGSKVPSQIAQNGSLDVVVRVHSTLDWLAGGYLPVWEPDHSHEHEQMLIDTWNSGKISVELIDPALAVIRSDFPQALRMLGYRYAPVVIAEGELEAGRKITIAQFEPGWIGLAELCSNLNAVEPGWGGSSTIIGSPQGVPCRTPLADVVGLAIRELRNLPDLAA